MIFLTRALLLILFMLTQINYAQTLHIINISGFTFDPDNITVTVGDTVRWQHLSGATAHNVLADDGSFTSGPPAPAPWTFNHVFTSAGSNPYYCEPHGGPGGSGMSGVVIVQEPVSVPEENFFADEFQLKQNYPNPFNPSTKISFIIPQESFVRIKVYDIIGNEIANLVNELKSAGSYEVEFLAENLSSGIYIYQLSAGNFFQTRKMLLLR